MWQSVCMAREKQLQESWRMKNWKTSKVKAKAVVLNNFTVVSPLVQVSKEPRREDEKGKKIKRGCSKKLVVWWFARAVWKDSFEQRKSNTSPFGVVSIENMWTRASPGHLVSNRIRTVPSEKERSAVLTNCILL